MNRAAAENNYMIVSINPLLLLSSMWWQVEQIVQDVQSLETPVANPG